MIEIPLSKTGKHAGKYVAIVDDCDADLAEFNWSAVIDKKVVYAQRTIYSKGEKRKAQSLHRAIFERTQDGEPLKEGELVDHRDGDGLNNQRYNLRKTDKKGNCANRGINSNNSSGFKGVTKKGNKWQAQITYNNKNHNLGYFDDPLEAHKAYCEAGERLHQEFFNSGVKRNET